MRLSARTLMLTLTLSLAGSLQAQQLREDSYRWYVGPQGGILMFETQTQTRSSIPTTGIHMLVMAKRAALQLAIDEAFGSDEGSAFGDAGAPNGTRPVTFGRMRKYSATLMAFPLRRAGVEPFLGIGFGVLHTVNTQVQGVFTSPGEAAISQAAAKDLGSTGFGSLVLGVQGRLSPSMVLYGQYMITTSPAAGNLIVGPSHGLTAGLRFSLGGAKEGIQGGGY